MVNLPVASLLANKELVALMHTEPLCWNFCYKAHLLKWTCLLCTTCYAIMCEACLALISLGCVHRMLERHHWQIWTRFATPMARSRLPSFVWTCRRWVSNFREVLVLGRLSSVRWMAHRLTLDCPGRVHWLDISHGFALSSQVLCFICSSCDSM